jgi:hypothetical protein
VTLVLAYTSNTPAHVLVVFSRLQAGGFSPFISDYHYGFIAIAHVLALGGFRIYLPEEEITDAKVWMKDIEPLPADIPIKDRPVRDTVFATVLTTNPLFALLHLPPLWLLILWSGLCVTISWVAQTPLVLTALSMSTGFAIIGILGHAKYTAVPRLRESRQSRQEGLLPQPKSAIPRG